jgi:hypothetical protein
MSDMFKVRDNLDFWFCRVDMAVFMDENLSIYDSHVYAALCTFSTSQDQNCFPSVKTLAKRAKCSERQARMSLRVLEEQGYITTTTQSGGVNIYTLTRSKRVPPAPARGADGAARDAGRAAQDADGSARDAGGAAQDAGDPGTGCRQTRSIELEPSNQNKDKDTPPSEGQAEPRPLPLAEPEPENAEELVSPEEVPAAMREVADYFLLKTQRPGLCPDELSAVRALEKIHTPGRVNAEITKAVERYGRNARPLSDLTLVYIYESLKYQTSGKASKDKNPPSQKKHDPYEGAYL